MTVWQKRAVFLIALLRAIIVSMHTGCTEEQGQKYRRPSGKTSIGSSSVEVSEAQRRIQEQGAGLVQDSPDRYNEISGRWRGFTGPELRRSEAFTL